MAENKVNSRLEKWNEYKQILDKKLLLFVESLKIVIPKNLYKVEYSGTLVEGFNLTPYYIHSFDDWYRGAIPTVKELKEYIENVESGIIFTTDKLSFEYTYLYSDNAIAKTGISFKDLVNLPKNYFFDKILAESYSNALKEQREKDAAFDLQYKKDKDYNYSANGYKFLGWQNGWKDTMLDENGNETTDVSKRKSYTYSRENYPEYVACREAGHRIVEVSHNNRGSEHSVSCPVCMIMWKYDSSD